MVSRPAAAEAMLPGLDQTRTVGLVALPGAFVGTLLGGASPVQAGAVQVLVLVALLAVQAARRRAHRRAARARGPAAGRADRRRTTTAPDRAVGGRRAHAWRVKGSNLRRLSRQIYSLLPLTTRATRPCTPSRVRRRR